MARDSEARQTAPVPGEGNGVHRRKRIAGYITLPLLLSGAVVIRLSRDGGEVPRWLLFMVLVIAVVGIPTAFWADSAFRSDDDS